MYVREGHVGCSYKFDPAGDSPDGTMITILLYNGVSVCFSKPSVFYDAPRTSAHPVNRSSGLVSAGVVVNTSQFLARPPSLQSSYYVIIIITNI